MKENKIKLIPDVSGAHDLGLLLISSVLLLSISSSSSISALSFDFWNFRRFSRVVGGNFSDFDR